MAAQPIDLSTCDEEPIHIPGSIQPHGVLLSLRMPELTIVQASENTDPVLGRMHQSLLGTELEDVLGDKTCATVRSALHSQLMGQQAPLRVELSGRSFDALLHGSEGLCIMELEPPETVDLCAWDELWRQTESMIEKLYETRNLKELFEIAALGIKRLTGFARVMIYRFHDDEHGEVVAEAKEEELEPYLHLHYPASDIPTQARRLYSLNRLRLIVDIDVPQVPITPPQNPLTGLPLDMSNAVLRSVSPVHIEYLRNMGVRSSMSISLLKDGRLYGLIACHHPLPRYVGCRLRRMCHLLGLVLSSEIVEKTRLGLADARHRGDTLLGRIISRTMVDANPLSALSADAQALLDLTGARGAAVSYEDEWVLLGQTPQEEEVRALATWAKAQMCEGIYATDRLPLLYPPARRFKDTAAGLLAIGLPAEDHHCILWFRPEVIQTVLWAGDPHKPAKLDPESQKIGPRASFAAWKQTVRRRALPWEPERLEFALSLRRGLIEIVLRRAAETSRLNAELTKAVHARDEFLSMASHELKTPVFTLELALTRLMRTAQRQGALPLEQVISQTEMLLRQTRRLEQLVALLLDISKISEGRLLLELEEVSLASLVDELVELHAEQITAARCEIVRRVDADLVGCWDRLRLAQVLENLLSNAIKYGAGGKVEIAASRLGRWVEIAITDQGIGIEPEAQSRIFERFERAASASHYAGMGLGLWIVRKIVESLGGSIALRSSPGVGSTFLVRLPLASREEEKAA